MKRTWIALSLTLALLLACLAGCGANADGGDLAARKATAAAIFTIDVNPGVRVYVEADNTVIAVEATNEDGEEIVAELDVEGENYEDAVEEIVDELEDQGFIEKDENSVLISVEKEELDVSEKLSERIDRAFEKHGKRAAIIEQKLDRAEEKLNEELDRIAKKHGISHGKANLIEKIRAEFPELSEEELAELNIGDLDMLLGETSEDIKAQFKRPEKTERPEYITKDEALTAALASLEITIEDIDGELQRTRVTHEKGTMVYLVKFVYGELSYEISVDAQSGEILSTESEEYVEIDPKEAIDDFCEKHQIKIDELKDRFEHQIVDRQPTPEQETEEIGAESDAPADAEEDRPEPEALLTRAEILEGVLTTLEIPEESLRKTDVRLIKTEDGAVFDVTVVLQNGDVYRLAVEAYSGTVLRAELNRVIFDISTEESL